MHDETTRLSPDDELPDSSPEIEVPEQIGPYRVLRELGEGGMGTVFEAEQREPVRRRVAIKLIKPGMDSKSVVARFDSERQALALMNHANIAGVIDAGATLQGRPYFAMEFVEGEPINSYCDSRRMTIDRRLALFLQVCAGVQHAHQKGVIHRDLKPSNVLVAESDGKPVAKIIDFGVAKATAQQLLADETVLTHAGQFIGTPEYMSPEQAELGGIDIDTRTDVYSLGILLYELLVGARPFDTERLRAVGVDEVRRVIREEEPPRPSARLHTLSGDAGQCARLRRLDPPSHMRRLRGDLDWVTLKALEKERSRRYSSAAELAEEIRRHLNHEPVLASPPSTLYRVGKFIRRHRTAVAAGTLVLVALLGGMTAALIGFVRAGRAEAMARAEAEVSEQVLDFMLGMFDLSKPSAARGREITVREMLDEGASRIEAQLERQPLVRARLMGAMGHAYRSLGHYGRSRQLLEESLQTLRRLLGEEHVAVIGTQLELGRVLSLQGDYVRSRHLLNTAVEEQERRLGPNHPEVVNTWIALARLLTETDDYEGARPLAERALEVYRSAHGPDHPHLATILDLLARIEHEKGELDAALSYYEQALEIREATLDQDDPDLALSYNNLATLLHDAGSYARAKELYEQALRTQQQLFAPDHPVLATTMHNLARLLAESDPARARSLFERALEIRGKALPPGHPELAHTANDLAFLLMNGGDTAGARTLFERALPILEQALGPQHPMVASPLTGLGRLCVESADYSAARQHLERARDILRESRGPAYSGVAYPLENLGRMYTALEDFAKAHANLDQALEILEKSLGRDHPDVAYPLTSQARLAVAEGDDARAEQYLVRALAIRPDLAEGLEIYASLLRRTGREEEASRRLTRAAEIRLRSAQLPR